jgi:hypothetical protein
MGIMQTVVKQCISAFIAVLFVFSALIFAFPHIAVAAPTLHESDHAMDGHMMDAAVCTFDCGDAEDCLAHCLSNNNDDQQLLAIVPSQNNVTVSLIPEERNDFSAPTNRYFFANTSDRAPPALLHIRSIRKLE